MRRSLFTRLVALIALGALWPAASVTAGPIQIYGAWHCSSDY